MSDIVTVGSIIAGGLATIGGALDYLVSPNEKQRIRDRLEPFFYKFRYLSWRTFGREEIEFSISVLERFFGPRLFSTRRWAAALLMTILAIVIEVSIAAANSGDSIWWKLEWIASDGGPIGLVFMLVGTVTAALSFSLSLFLSKTTLRVPGGATIPGLIVLLVIHVILLILWRPFVAFAEDWVKAIAVLSTIPRSAFRPPITSWFDYVPLMLSAAWIGIQNYYKQLIDLGLWNWFVETYFPVDELNTAMGQEGNYALFEGILALLVNLLRFALSIGFLGIVLYIKMVRPLIIRAWSALIRPDAALFTPPLAAIGAGIAFMERLPSIVRTLMP
jgi:hypothetical protein